MQTKKTKQLQSKEAQAVARNAEEFEILSDAIKEINKLLSKAKGVEKKQLQVKIADLEVQKQLTESRKNYAYSKFSVKYGNEMSADDISSAIKNGHDEPTKRTTTTKVIQEFGKTGRLIVDSWAKLEAIDYEKQIADIKATTDILMASIDLLGQKAVMAADLMSKAYTASVDTSITSLIGDVNKGAYAAAANVIDLGAQAKIMGLEQERIDLETLNKTNVATAQKETSFKNIDAQKTQAWTNIISEGGRRAGHMADGASIAGFSLGNAPGAIADAAADVAEGIAAANVAVTQAQGNLYNLQVENTQKVTEAQLKYNQEVAKKWIESASHVEKAWLQFAQKIEGGLLKSEAIANDMGIGMGFSGEQLKRFKQSMFETQVAVSKWGKTMEDMRKMQNSYQEATGRNIQFSSEDFDTSFALDYLAGQDGLSAQLTGAMELFNHSVSDSNEMFGEMYKSVSKIGLDGRKFLKDLTKNLKLAERFNFKGGVKGMMEMAKWAQNTRFNMDSLPEILESISSEGLEGAITKAAGMQVLGGQFAMGADPLAMLWERYNDPMALAQRENDMLRGIGSYDSETGEVSFNMVEQLQLEQFAKYAGQSVEDLMNQQRQRIKGERMGNLLQGKDWDKDEQALITNKAQLKNGEWIITMNNGEDKRVADLNRNDLDFIKPETNEEKLVDHVAHIRSLLDQSEALKTGIQSRLELDGLESAYKEVEQRISQVMNDFNTNYDTYLNEFLSKMHLATESQKTMLDIMAQGNKNIESAQEDILQEGKNIASTLSKVNTLISQSLNEINGKKAPTVSTASSQTSPQTSKAKPNNVNYETLPKKEKLKVDAESGDFASAVQNSHIGRGSIMDGIASGDGQSMSVFASKVTPIRDGSVQLAKSDPKDSAVFAKTGGPFDTLFNGIFDKISLIYDSFSGNPTKIEPKSLPYEFPEISSRESYIDNSTNNKNDAPTNSQSPLRVEPITLNINLNGALGQSKDFMEELSKNPLMIRTLTQLIAENISKSINGGRATQEGLLQTTRFKGMGI